MCAYLDLFSSISKSKTRFFLDWITFVLAPRLSPHPVHWWKERDRESERKKAREHIAMKGDRDGESTDRVKGVWMVGEGRVRRSTVAWNEQAWRAGVGGAAAVEPVGGG